MLFSNYFSYCTKFHTLIIPEYWVCEPCGSKCVSTSPLKEDRGIGSRASKMYQTSKTAKVKSLTKDEVIRLSSGASHPVSSTIVLGKHRRNDEIHKKTMTSKHASCSLSKGENFSPPLLSSPFFYFLLTFMIHVLILRNRI